MTTIKLKNGSGAPAASDLVQGEPALDLTNKRLYTEDSGGTVIEVGTNPTTLSSGDITSTGTVEADTMLINTSSSLGTDAKLSIKSSAAYSSGIIIESDASASNWARMDFSNSNVTDTGIIFYDQAGTFGFRNNNESGSATFTDIVGGNTTAGIIRLKPSTSTEALRIDANARCIVPVGITLGTGGTTYVAANTIDDYEEGTFTPVFLGSTTAGEFTYQSQIGNYTKVGDVVTCVLRVQISGVTTAADGELYISGLPFSAKNVTDQIYSGSIGYTGGFSSTNGPSTIRVSANGTIMVLGKSASADARDVLNVAVDASEADANDVVIATITYLTD